MLNGRNALMKHAQLRLPLVKTANFWISPSASVNGDKTLRLFHLYFQNVIRPNGSNSEHVKKHLLIYRCLFHNVSL